VRVRIGAIVSVRPPAARRSDGAVRLLFFFYIMPFVGLVRRGARAARRSRQCGVAWGGVGLRPRDGEWSTASRLVVVDVGAITACTRRCASSGCPPGRTPNIPASGRRCRRAGWAGGRRAATIAMRGNMRLRSRSGQRMRASPARRTPASPPRRHEPRGRAIDMRWMNEAGRGTGSGGASSKR
jgi:hypothetical protein